ncbi:LCK-like protein, partial [Mya arenaria]
TTEAQYAGKICLEPYRRPKALPCLHSFCEHCLSDYVRRNSGSRSGYFACPMCRKEDNFILLSLSDTLHEDDSGEIWQKDGYPLSPPRSLAPPTPLEVQLRQYDRNASEEWLLSSGYPKGSFLVRQGEASPDTLTLSVRDCDELRGYLVKHYKILTRRQNRTEYFFITPKRMFDSMSEMVEHYLESADGLCCRLSQVCSKPRSLSWAQDRGKEDDYSTHRDTVTLVRRLGSGQFADVWEEAHRIHYKLRPILDNKPGLGKVDLQSMHLKAEDGTQIMTNKSYMTNRFTCEKFSLRLKDMCSLFYIDIHVMICIRIVVTYKKMGMNKVHCVCTACKEYLTVFDHHKEFRKQMASHLLNSIEIFQTEPENMRKNLNKLWKSEDWNK